MRERLKEKDIYIEREREKESKREKENEIDREIYNR